MKNKVIVLDLRTKQQSRGAYLIQCGRRTRLVFDDPCVKYQLLGNVSVWCVPESITFGEIEQWKRDGYKHPSIDFLYSISTN
jgi:hypothetical protein